MLAIDREYRVVVIYNGSTAWTVSWECWLIRQGILEYETVNKTLVELINNYLSKTYIIFR